jgi:hypothetical protein
MSSTLSLYIPHVFTNISKERIAEIFSRLQLGKVSNIDFVLKMSYNGDEYHAVYIHFEHWFNNASAFSFQQSVRNSSEGAKLVYDMPWYWVVLENKAKKHVSGVPKTRIALDELFVTSMKKASLRCPRLPIAPTLSANSNCDLMPTNLSSEFEEYAHEYPQEYANAEYAAEEDDWVSTFVTRPRPRPAATAAKINDELFDQEMDQILDEMGETEKFMSEESFDQVDASYATTMETECARLTQWCFYYQGMSMNLQMQIEDIQQSNIPLFDELQDLRSEVAYLKDVLAQYEPDVSKQNKDLYR